MIILSEKGKTMSRWAEQAIRFILALYEWKEVKDDD